MLDNDDFFKLVYGSGGLPKIKNLDNDIRYFSYRDLNRNQNDNGNRIYYCVLFNRNKIIGLSKLQESNLANNFWICYISINEKYRLKGYSSLLLDCLFRWASESGYSLETSGYSKLGYARLKHQLKMYSDKYCVELIDDQEYPKFENISMTNKVLKFYQFINETASDDEVYSSTASELFDLNQPKTLDDISAGVETILSQYSISYRQFQKPISSKSTQK